MGTPLPWDMELRLGTHAWSGVITFFADGWQLASQALKRLAVGVLLFLPFKVWNICPSPI